MRRAGLLMAVALLAGACGTSVGIITEDSMSPTTATTFAAVTTTTTPTTTTTIPEVVLDSELEAQLDELEEQWTSKCEATTNRHAKRIVEKVREWDPTQSQGLGDFGGDMSLLRGDLTLDRSCPVAGYAVRLLVLVDEATPAGEPNVLLGVVPFVESSLAYVMQEHGADVAARLAPEVDPDAPPPPVVPDVGPSSCADLRTQLAVYYFGLVEAANAVAPLDGLAAVGSLLSSGGPGLVNPDCPYEALLFEILDGLAEAEPISFVATTLRWSAVGQLRDALRPVLIGPGQLSLDEEMSEDNYVAVLTHRGSEPVQNLLVEVWATTNDQFHLTLAPGFTWSQETLRPGEEVRVDSGVPFTTELEYLITWVDSDGITYRNDFVLSPLAPSQEESASP